MGGASATTDDNFNNPYTGLSQLSATGQPLINGLPQGVSDILSTGSQNLGNQTNQFLPQIQQYLKQAQGGVDNATGQAVNQLQGLANSDYMNLTQQLSPTGQAGKQLAGEYNNYGITPNSGAFQEGLANQYAPLLMQSNQQQAGVINAGSQLDQSLGAQSGTMPLNLLTNTLGQQQSLTNEATQLPIQNYENSLGFSSAQNLGSQNVSAQNNAAQAGLYGSLGSAGLMALAK